MRRAIGWFGVLAAAAALAGCSGRKGAGGGGNANVVRIAFFPNVTHAVALAGLGNGEFAKAFGNGVKVEPQKFTAGPAEIEALFADQVDIGYIGPGPAVNGFLKSQGGALRVIAGASSGGAGLVVRKGAGITDIKDLAGKRVAVPQTGGTQDISLRHFLQMAGLTSRDKGGTVNVLPSAPADTLTLFQKGELDAAWVPEPWVSRLVKEGNGELLKDERDLWPNRRFATTVVIARKAFLDAHPDLVAKFLAAHVATISGIERDPDKARQVVGGQIKTLTGKALPDDVLKDALGRTDITWDPLADSIRTFAGWSQALGYQRAGGPSLNNLVDIRPLNAALKQAGKPAVP